MILPLLFTHFQTHKKQRSLDNTVLRIKFFWLPILFYALPMKGFLLKKTHACMHTKRYTTLLLLTDLNQITIT